MRTLNITKNNVHMFVPLKAKTQGFEYYFLTYTKSDGEVILGSDEDDYCYFECIDFSNSLKDFSELTKEDWRDVFEAGGINCDSVTIHDDYVESNSTIDFFEFDSFQFVSPSLFNQLNAFRVLIEKLKR